MPRNGDGSSDNGPFEEAKHDIIHGSGNVESSHVDRADKTADLPEGKDEQGLALKDVNASGGQSQGLAHGKDAGQGNQK
ncbi:glutathione s-transferase [Fusarium longipes]|uniref:Glutathione s-transferase n=1 Tax=Fusarium longipes TaxID=694270 RepID=A0A395RK99_9HYPO|nr:glutathione s-transferase [Fusarium longipes]